MAGKAGQPSKRLVRHTPDSRADLISIYFHNEISYGPNHADRYIAFLTRELEKIAENPDLGAPVDGFNETQVYLARTNSRRATHGYRMFYRTLPDCIEVIRILHTKMDWSTRLKED